MTADWTTFLGSADQQAWFCPKNGFLFPPGQRATSRRHRDPGGAPDWATAPLSHWPKCRYTFLKKVHQALNWYLPDLSERRPMHFINTFYWFHIQTNCKFVP
jgi:hypothetical protein